MKLRNRFEEENQKKKKAISPEVVSSESFFKTRGGVSKPEFDLFLPPPISFGLIYSLMCTNSSLSNAFRWLAWTPFCSRDTRSLVDFFAVCPQKVKVCPGEDSDSEKGKAEGTLAWNWFKINHGITCYSHTQLYRS